MALMIHNADERLVDGQKMKLADDDKSPDKWKFRIE